MINKFVIIRTFSAGVHCGTLLEQSQSGMIVNVGKARRIWRWSGANTLNELAVHGAGEDSRISEPVDLIQLTQAIEIIPCTKQAQANLERSRWSAS